MIHIHIWQVSPQLYCNDICQIQMWYLIGKYGVWVILKIDEINGSANDFSTDISATLALLLLRGSVLMMTSSNGNNFQVTRPMWGESTGHQWITLTKVSDSGLWCFIWSAPEQTVEQIIETPVIWDAITLIIKSLVRGSLMGRWNPMYHHLSVYYDDVIKWKHFPRYWPFVREIHRSPVISPHKGQWRGALMFSSICVWINGWVNNRDAVALRRHRAHYYVIVMCYICSVEFQVCIWIKHIKSGQEIAKSFITLFY